MRIHIRILPDVFVAISIDCQLLDLCYRALSSLTYELVEHSKKTNLYSKVFCKILKLNVQSTDCQFANESM